MPVHSAHLLKARFKLIHGQEEAKFDSNLITVQKRYPLKMFDLEHETVFKFSPRSLQRKCTTQA